MAELTRWLITGASGQLGTNLIDQMLRQGLITPQVHCVAKTPGKILNVPIKPVDLRRPAAVVKLLSDTRPNIVMHLAGIASPLAASRDAPSAAALHHTATGLLASYAKHRNAWVFFASSDFVHSGKRDEPYTESDPAEPMTLYGETKLSGEQTILENGAGAAARLSFLWGEVPHRPASNWNAIGERLARGQPIVGIADEIRSPMRFSEAASAILTLAAQRFRGIVNFAGDEHISPYELLLRIRSEARSTSHVRPVSRCEYSPDLLRPRNVSLDNALLQRLLAASHGCAASGAR